MPSFEFIRSSSEWFVFIKLHQKLFLTILICAGLAISLVDLGWLILIGNQTVAVECPNPTPSQEATDSGQILVDVRGEVVNPGVYVMKLTQRLGDAIQKAGGLTKLANARYVLHALNYAQPLEDAQKIYIPHLQETEYCQPINQFSSEVLDRTTTNASLVSINTASQSELETLVGIGAKRAQDIVAGRPYQNINQLIEQKIVTNDIFEQIKSEISL